MAVAESVNVGCPFCPLGSGQYSPIVNTDLQNLGRRLVGRWATEATHPAVPGTVIAGSSQVEWLEGERFLIYRTHYDHPDFPDALSIIGDTGGLRMHYFDIRGVYRLFELTVAADGWAIAMGLHGDPPFAQRMTYTYGHADQVMSGKGQLSRDGVSWDDDLQITYRRAS
jgi:hypothetical protein